MSDPIVSMWGRYLADEMVSDSRIYEQMTEVRRRTWRERLLTRPWRPFRKTVREWKICNAHEGAKIRYDTQVQL